MKTIKALGYQTFEDYRNGAGCVCDDECDTIKEAKSRAKLYITTEFQESCEMSQPLEYSQVVVNGECIYDFFRK